MTKILEATNYVKKLSHNKIVKLTLEAENLIYAKEALKLITDEQVFAQIAVNSKAKAIRMHAIKRIHDNKILYSIAMSDLHPTVRIAATNQITDEGTLKCLYTNNCKHWKVRELAISKIHDQEFLKQVFESKEDKSVPIKISAIKNITDQIYLKEIVLRCSHYYRKNALKGIDDQKILSEIALKFNYYDRNIIIRIFNKISDDKIWSETLNKYEEKYKNNEFFYSVVKTIKSDRLSKK